MANVTQEPGQVRNVLNPSQQTGPNGRICDKERQKWCNLREHTRSVHTEKEAQNQSVARSCCREQQYVYSVCRNMVVLGHPRCRSQSEKLYIVQIRQSQMQNAWW